jgi:outer membrane immunogenic protein
MSEFHYVEVCHPISTDTMACPLLRLSIVKEKPLNGAVMTKLTRFLMGCIAAGALNVSAHAADLPMKAMPDPAPVWTWTGFYIGGNGGAGWGTTESSLTSLSVPGFGVIPFGLPVAQNSRSGFLGGGQLGYNYQAGWVVVGVQGDIDALSINGTTPCIVTFSCTSNSKWLATASARVGGVVGERTLVYIKGGGAWLNTQQTLSASSGLGGIVGIGGGLVGGSAISATSTASGALIGMGAEYMFSRNWTGFIEYNYMEFGTKNLTFPVPAAGVPGAALSASTSNKLSIAKIGLNYKF